MTDDEGRRRSSPRRRPVQSLPRGVHDLDRIPHVHDGLTRIERVVLYCLHETQKEFPGRNVPTATLYGRVVEHVNVSVGELQDVLRRLVGRG